jgi:type II secretory pathway component GspD/PulD (secretin)
VLKQPATQFSPAIYDVQEDRVGIYLQVAAQIASDGTISLNLYPQVSTISGYLNINGSNLPQISTREARTIMRMVSGQTIVMGGLIQDKDINTLEKVPILGDIPVLGEFFKRRQKSKLASQLIITITPRIVDVTPAP